MIRFHAWYAAIDYPFLVSLVPLQLTPAPAWLLLSAPSAAISAAVMISAHAQAKHVRLRQFCHCAGTARADGPAPVYSVCASWAQAPALSTWQPVPWTGSARPGEGAPSDPSCIITLPSDAASAHCSSRDRAHMNKGHSICCPPSGSKSPLRL